MESTHIPALCFSGDKVCHGTWIAYTLTMTGPEARADEPSSNEPQGERGISMNALQRFAAAAVVTGLLAPIASAQTPIAPAQPQAKAKAPQVQRPQAGQPARQGAVAPGQQKSTQGRPGAVAGR